MNECVFCFASESIHCAECGQYLCIKHYFRNHGTNTNCMIDEGRYTEFPSYNETLPLFGTLKHPFLVNTGKQFSGEK